MPRSPSFFVPFLLCLVLAVYRFSEASNSCIWTAPNGNMYNLSPLMNNQGDYKVNVGNTSFWINMCRPVLTSTCSGSDIAACKIIQEGEQASLGQASSAMFSYLEITNSLLVQFSGGKEGKQFDIKFYCDQTAGQGSPMFVNEDPSNIYHFSWISSYACATDPCRNLTSCGDCTAIGQCKWCYLENTCFPLDTGCTSFATNQKYCLPDCSSLTNCDACASHPQCSYCLDTDTCVPKNQANSCGDIVGDSTLCTFF